MWKRRIIAIVISTLIAVGAAWAVTLKLHTPFWMVLEFALPLAVVYTAMRWNSPRANRSDDKR